MAAALELGVAETQGSQVPRNRQLVFEDLRVAIFGGCFVGKPKGDQQLTPWVHGLSTFWKEVVLAENQKLRLKRGRSATWKLGECADADVFGPTSPLSLLRPKNGLAFLPQRTDS